MEEEINSTTISNDMITRINYETVIPLTIIYTIIFFTGVIGNISTCIVIAKNKSMHTATNYYLFSLAVSDMLLLISSLPPETYRYWSPKTYIFGYVICLLQGYSAETSANATVLTITAFTAERYLAICHPFLSHTMSKLSRCIRIIIIIWCVALAFAVPQATQFGVVHELNNGEWTSSCSLDNKRFVKAFEVSSIVFFVTPMLIITILYILIGLQLRKSTAKRPSLTQHSNSNCTVLRYATHCGSSSDASRRRVRQSQAQNRVVRMLVAVVVAFFICWAPFHSQRVIAVYLNDANVEDQKTYWTAYIYLNYISGVLYYLSTCINPLLYNLMSNKYRNAFKKTFHSLCFRSSRSHNYQPAPVQQLRTSTMKKYPDIFLGEAMHLARTADARTTFNQQKWKVNSKLSPQTSQTSFSSSKLDTSQSQLQNDMVMKSTADCASNNQQQQPPSCASLKNRVMRFFKSGLSQSYGMSQSLREAHSISNSSLKDTDEMDLVCADLVRQMKQVNENV